MPIDPSIYGNIRPVQPIPTPSPLDLITSVAQLQGIREQTEQRRLAGEKARQQAQDEAAVRRVLTETNGDIEAALPRLMTIAPEAALKFKTEIAAQQQHAAARLSSEMDYKGKQLTYGLNVLAGMDDPAGYRAGRPMLAAMSPDLDKFLPPEYDPATTPAVLQRLGTMALTAKEKHDLQQEGFKQLLGDHPVDGLSKLYRTAQNQEQWDTIGRGAIAVGAKPALLDQFGPTWSPEAVQRAASLGISSEKEADLAGQAATRERQAAAEARTAAHQAALEENAAAQLGISRGQLGVAQARERRETATPELVQVLQDGKAVWVPKAQAIGQPAAGGAAGKPATALENKTFGFYTRAKDALDILTTPDPTTKKSLEETVSGEGLKAGDVPFIGNYLLSEAGQRYKQAERMFAEAHLRRESGATIKDSEMAEVRRTYFKQPGDSAAVIAQKKQARETLVSGLATSAGKAYEENYGEPYKRDTGTTPGAPKEGTPGMVNGVPAVWKTVNGKAGWYKQ